MLQAYEEFDEEVQEAEELEARALAGGPAAHQADRDDEIKPFVHKCATYWWLPGCCGVCISGLICGQAAARWSRFCTSARWQAYPVAAALAGPTSALNLRAVGMTTPCNLPSQTCRGTGHGEEAQEGEEEEDEDEGDGIVHWNLRRSSAGACHAVPACLGATPVHTVH